MFSANFLKDAVERATKTAAQAALAVFGVGATELAEVNLGGTLLAAGLGFVASLLTSVASKGSGDSETASLVK